MKNEKELLALPFGDIDLDIPEPQEVVRKSYYGTEYTTTKTTYGYTAQILDGKILTVTVYDHYREPKFRIFISDYDYIAQRSCSDGWHRSTAKISSLYNTSDYRTWSCEEFLTSEADRATALSWLKCYKNDNPDVFKRIAAYVDDIKKQRIEARHERIRKSVDEITLQIRPLPKDFEKWADSVPFKENRYILYQYSKRKIKDGYCTHCKTHVKVTGAKHQQRGVCPNCKSKITYLASGITSHFKFDETVIYIQQGKDNELIFRYFTYYRDFYKNGDRLEMYDHMRETYREFYNAGKIYEYCNPWNNGQYQFMNRGGWYQHITERGYIYPRNIKKVFMKSAPQYKHLQYIPYSKMLRNIPPVSAADFYTTCVKYPQVEYLTKLKMYKLCGELINDNYNIVKDGTENIFKALAITKQDIPYIQKYNMGCSEIAYIYRSCKQYDLSALPALLKINGKSHNFAADTAKMLKYASFAKINEYIEQQMPYYREQCKNYWRIPSDIEIKRDIVSDWKDYIENCKSLGWNIEDTKVIRPKNLIERHDMTDELVELDRSKIEAENIHRHYYENIFDLGYSDNDYTVTIPRNIEDLKYEGDNMHHCVYTNYAASVADGNCIILFIRLNSEFYKPLATAEIDPETYEVIQIRGEYNHPVDENVSKFFDKYKQKVLNKLKISRKAA